MKLSILIPVFNQEDLVIKALDCLPRRDDIEVLVRDDGSTDETLKRLMDYHDPALNLKVYANNGNKGVAYTKNRLLEFASGDYFHIHDSDDHVDTEAYNALLDKPWDTDIICFDLIVNNGSVLKLRDDTQAYYCAQIARFIRREFAEGITFPEDIRAGDDGYYAVALMERNPSIWFSEVPAYYYNFPREGSLCDLRLKGVLP